MADWPTLADLQRQTGASAPEDEAMLSQALAASIEQVLLDCGYTGITVALTDPPTAQATDPDDVESTVTPSSSQSRAAHLLTVMVWKAPDAPHGIAAVFDTGGLRVAAQHPTYQRLLVGQRLAFGLA